jgi:proton-coupled amino acid transporter
MYFVYLQLGDYYSGIDIPVRTYMLCLIPAVVLLGQIRHLKILVPFSVIANMSLTVGFAITLYYIFSDIQPLENIHYVSTWAQMPKFFATVIFAIEGIGTVSIYSRLFSQFYFGILRGLV